jgi:hypothetical protein
MNRPQTTEELDAVRQSVIRSGPFGSARWAKGTVKKLGLE